MSPLIVYLKNCAEKASKQLFLGILGFYKAHISCHMMSACRFYPTCSDYAVETLKSEKALTAVRMILCRLGKCHPFYPLPKAQNE